MADVVKHTFQPGEMIFIEGEPGFIAYVIDEGKVEIVKKTPDGEKVLATMGRGEVIGEMALIDNALRSASARAAEVTTCMVISGAAFKQWMDALDPVVRRLLMRFVAIARAAQGAEVTEPKPKPKAGYHGAPPPGTYRKRP